MKLAGLVTGVGAVLLMFGNVYGVALIVIGLITMVCVEGSKIEDDGFHVM
mgnify:CR=1 FL=1|tara:strand:+ start:1975 stop:2124 length:150 start_codon:yes stop_codon:yes gene_type:complete